MWQKIKNIYHLIQAIFANLYYGFPSKKLIVIGVTGTDGKTTTAHMIYEILKSSGKKVSLISSVFAAIGNKSYDTGFHVTTPDPIALQGFIKKIADNGSKYLILEVTSHGLDQNRVFGVNFEIGILTNITHEHFDYHKTYDQYLKAKAKLFKNVKYSILNIGDTSFSRVKELASGKILTYGKSKKADINLNNFPIKLKLLGDYNIQNALAAAAACSILGISNQAILEILENFQGVIGRMEEVNLGQDFEVIVDFAHTPNALTQALKTLKTKVLFQAKPVSISKNPKSKVIAVFGAAGLRDRNKRSLMGEAAAKYADISILTSEDPRTEKVEDICNQISQGLIKNRKQENRDFYFIYNRTKAIQFAINLAQKGDIVATFGKSHEKSMCYGKHEYPWDEFATVEKALKERLNNERK